MRRALLVVVFVAAVLGLLVAVQKVPEWQVKRASVRSTKILPEAETTPSDIAKLQDEMRKTFVQVVGGVFVALALWLTYRRTRVTEQGHITDRYTKAIEQLGATKEVNGKTQPNLEVRLGAIYALERIALDSPRDHWTIMEVLTAYVRENARWFEIEPTLDERVKTVAFKGPVQRVRPTTEIQAILTVLGRRKRDAHRERDEQWLDLRECDLRGAEFRRAHLEGANFFAAHAQGASFQYAHLQRAVFARAHLEGASFTYAHLEEAYFGMADAKGANFGGAHLEGARLINASVEGAFFMESHLRGANFWETDVSRTDFYQAHAQGGDFRGATGMTAEKIRKAEGWEGAIYDKDFERELGLVQPKEPTEQTSNKVR